jgi:hypothetical protein
VLTKYLSVKWFLAKRYGIGILTLCLREKSKTFWSKDDWLANLSILFVDKMFVRQLFPGQKMWHRNLSLMFIRKNHNHFDNRLLVSKTVTILFAAKCFLAKRHCNDILSQCLREKFSILWLACTCQYYVLAKCLSVKCFLAKRRDIEI